jgi:hypothetical protein
MNLQPGGKKTFQTNTVCSEGLNTTRSNTLPSLAAMIYGMTKRNSVVRGATYIGIEDRQRVVCHCSHLR